MGTQGLCAASRDVRRQNVLVARAAATVGSRSTVPVKIINPTDNSVTLDKNLVLADFKVLDASYDIIPADTACSSVPDPACCNMHEAFTPFISDQTDDGSTHVPSHSCDQKPDFQTFMSNFDLTGIEVSADQLAQLSHSLYNNRDVFVTAENPNLGSTHL